jgi:acyl-CoA hydrolase
MRVRGFDAEYRSRLTTKEELIGRLDSDYVIHRVRPMDERGMFNFSLTASWEYEYIRWLRENRPDTRVVFEVNSKLPRVFGLEEFGNNELPIDCSDIIVEDDSDLLDIAHRDFRKPLAGMMEKAGMDLNRAADIPDPPADLFSEGLTDRSSSSPTG